MSKSSFGVISNELSYTHRELANVLGISDAAAKDFIRRFDVKHIEPIEGVLVASGRLINFAIETASVRDTPEAAAERKRKSGWDTRRAKAAEKAKEAKA